MFEVTVTVQQDQMITSTPFHPDFPPRARKLGGHWDGPTRTWRFASRDQTRVEQLLGELFGFQAKAPGATCIVRVTLPDSINEPEARFGGRRIAVRRSRDSEVILADDVVVVSGTFDFRGGSMRYPALGDTSGVVLEVRDFPVEALDVAVEYPHEVVDGDPHASLREERDRLITRLAEIEAILNGIS